MSRPYAVAWVLVVASLGAGLTGCRVQTDLGVECLLVRKGAVEGETAYITNAEVKPGQEYISFGAAQCDDLVCVRDANFPVDSANPGQPAKGYCSKHCVPQDGPSLNDSCPAANADDDRKDSPNRLTCREVLLDPETLAAYKAADPVGYEEHFPPDVTPYYCARGGVQVSEAAP